MSPPPPLVHCKGQLSSITTGRWGASSFTPVLPVYWRSYHILCLYGGSSFPNLQKLNYLTSFQTVTANCTYGLVCGWRISYCPVLVGTVWCDISFYCVYFGYEGRFGWFFVLARAHRRPLCRSISVIVVFTGWARAAFVKSF